VFDIVGNDTIVDVFQRRLCSVPDREAAVFEGVDGSLSSYTFSDLDQLSESAANGLWNAGIRPHSPVALYLSNSVEFLVAWLAANKLGAPILPCNTNFTMGEARYVIHRVAAPVLITDELGWDKLKDLPDQADVTPIVIGGGEHVLSWEEMCDSQGALERPGGSPDADATSEILFTSGTTADPKGVVLSHGALLRGAHQIAAIFAVRDDDRLMTAFPLFHANAQIATWLTALVTGSTAVFQSKFSASGWSKQAKAHGATLGQFVGTMVRMMMAQPPSESDPDHQVRAATFGLPIELDLWHQFEQRFGVQLVQGYGLTEASLFVTAMPLYGDRRIPSVGRPALGRQIRIRVDHDRDALPGEVGEIVVAGELGRNFMTGYFEDEASTMAAFENGWFRTSDLGYLDDDGYLFFVDRKKDIIKRSGENVSALEVEVTLAAVERVADVAVFAAPDPIRDEAVIACITTEPGVGPPTPAALVSHVAETLAKFKWPTVYVVCEELPRNAVGKVDKKMLRRTFRTELITGNDEARLLSAEEAFMEFWWKAEEE
jgi:crotonobetaine/carnitine-CoA ligase